MSTWRGREPPAPAPIGPAGHLRAALRLAVLGSMTAVLLAVFLSGRWLAARMPGRRVSYHFAVARLWSRATLRLFGLRLEVRGTPIGAGALVANHSSWLDIPALRAVRLIYFVAKSEVEHWPVIGYVTRVCGTIYIERRRAAAKAQEQMLRRLAEHGRLLCFFPEGTSTDGLRVLPFKSSLFAAFFRDHEGADFLVQPVTVRHAPASDAPLPPCFYGWWGDMDLGRHLWRVAACSRGGRTTVVFHPPLRPRDFPDRKALAVRCHALVAEAHRELLAAEGSAGAP